MNTKAVRMCVILKHAHLYRDTGSVMSLYLNTLAMGVHLFKSLHLVFDSCFKLVLQHKAGEEKGGRRRKERGRREGER